MRRSHHNDCTSDRFHAMPYATVCRGLCLRHFRNQNAAWRPLVGGAKEPPLQTQKAPRHGQLQNTGARLEAKRGQGGAQCQKHTHAIFLRFLNCRSLMRQVRGHKVTRSQKLRANLRNNHAVFICITGKRRGYFSTQLGKTAFLQQVRARIDECAHGAVAAWPQWSDAGCT